MATTSGNVRAKSAMKALEAPLEDILRWAGKPDGSETTLVNLEAVRNAREAERDAGQAVAEEAAAGSDQRRARAGRTRQTRGSKRVKLDFKLEPQDRETLREVQAWIDDQRAKTAWEPPAGWRPGPDDRKKGSEPGTITYKTPGGWVDNVPADDFRQMINGYMSWKVPNPEPSYREQREQADKLADLSFQDKECRLCHWPIERTHGPEMAQIRKLLNGRLVLPYISHSLEPGQEELRFRRLHLLCSLWEEELAVIQLEFDVTSDQEIVERLHQRSGKVFEEAKKRNPQVTEDDVYATLDTVLELWEKEEAGLSG